MEGTDTQEVPSVPPDHPATEVLVESSHSPLHSAVPSTPFFPEIAALDSLCLDSNPKYISLKSTIERFLHQTKLGEKVSLFPGKSQQWTEVVISSVLKALTELFL